MHAKKERLSSSGRSLEPQRAVRVSAADENAVALSAVYSRQLLQLNLHATETRWSGSASTTLGQQPGANRLFCDAGPMPIHALYLNCKPGKLCFHPKVVDGFCVSAESRMLLCARGTCESDNRRMVPKWLSHSATSSRAHTGHSSFKPDAGWLDGEARLTKDPDTKPTKRIRALLEAASTARQKLNRTTGLDLSGSKSFGAVAQTSRRREERPGGTVKTCWYHRRPKQTCHGP